MTTDDHDDAGTVCSEVLLAVDGLARWVAVRHRASAPLAQIITAAARQVRVPAPTEATVRRCPDEDARRVEGAEALEMSDEVWALREALVADVERAYIAAWPPELHAHDVEQFRDRVDAIIAAAIRHGRHLERER